MTITTRFKGTQSTLWELVHEVTPNNPGISLCGRGFSHRDAHYEPQVVTCLWCVAYRSSKGRP